MNKILQGSKTDIGSEKMMEKLTRVTEGNVDSSCTTGVNQPVTPGLPQHRLDCTSLLALSVCVSSSRRRRSAPGSAPGSSVGDL